MPEIGTFKLNNSDIFVACSQMEKWLHDNHGDRDETQNARLLIEDALLHHKETFGEDSEFTIEVSSHIGRKIIHLAIPGKRCKPHTSHERIKSGNSDPILSNDVRLKIATTLHWTYSDDVNNYEISVKNTPRIPSIVRIFIAMGLAIASGLLMLLLPSKTQIMLTEDLISPLCDAIIALISGVAVVLTFASIWHGICSLGDLPTFSRIGKKLFSKIGVMTVIAVFISVALSLLLFKLDWAKGSTDFELSSFVNMLLNLVPDGIVPPFASNDAMGIVILAILFGVASLMLGTRIPLIFKFVYQINLLFDRIMDIISRTLPFFVYLAILCAFGEGDMETLLQVWKPMLLIIAITAIIFFADLLHTSKTVGIAPKLLFNKIRSAMIIGLTTASSTAGLTLASNACRDKLGIDSSITGLGIPLLQMFEKPAFLVTTSVITFSLASIYDISISSGWIILAVITVTIITVAGPPSAGRGAVVLSIVLGQMGIPSAAVALGVIIDLITDFPCTAMEMGFMQMTLLNAALDLKMVNEPTLKSENAGEKH